MHLCILLIQIDLLFQQFSSTFYMYLSYPWDVFTCRSKLDFVANVDEQRVHFKRLDSEVAEDGLAAFSTFRPN